MLSPLSNLHIIVSHPRFPENIGMIARACANMGCPNLIVIHPEIWNYEAALKLATSQGKPVLDNMIQATNLEQALENMHLVCATTARLGGYRKEVMPPDQAVKHIAPLLVNDMQVAIILGSEDRGLNNIEILQADIIAHIPTAQGASSLNVAQAALLMLYECFKHTESTRIPERHDRLIRHSEMMILEAEFKKALLALDCLPDNNTNYFFQVWKTILHKSNLRRNEFNAIMGLCRQIGIITRNK